MDFDFCPDIDPSSRFINNDTIRIRRQTDGHHQFLLVATAQVAWFGPDGWDDNRKPFYKCSGDLIQTRLMKKS